MWDKANKFPHLYFILTAFFWGLGGHYICYIHNMTNKLYLLLIGIILNLICLSSNAQTTTFNGFEESLHDYYWESKCTKIYNFSANQGSLFYFTLVYRSWGGTNTNRSETLNIILDNDTIYHKVCVHELDQNYVITIPSDGEHTLKINIVLKNIRCTLKGSNIKLEHTITNQQGLYFFKTNDALKLAYKSTYSNPDSVVIPAEVSIPFDGIYKVKEIGDSAFKDVDIKYLSIPNTVTKIHANAAIDCKNLLRVDCEATSAPYVYPNSFPANTNIHVYPNSEWYDTNEWSYYNIIYDLGKIVELPEEEPEVQKCATPVVTYAEGKLSFSCETEGAEFVTDITSSDFKKHYDAEIELSATYNIEVYATKANYENSDTVSVALVWVENGNVDEETGIISVPAAPVLVQGNGGILTVSGVAKDTEVTVYTISGTEVARATATEGTATISTGLQSGTIVVVKFGNKSVKVRI